MENVNPSEIETAALPESQGARLPPVLQVQPLVSTGSITLGLLPHQLHGHVEKVILEVPTVVGCARDVVGDLFQGDVQESGRHRSDISGAGRSQVGVNKDRAVR